ncbi:uncharacterized protein LOC144109928 [Amblyomma americanum]
MMPHRLALATWQKKKDVYWRGGKDEKAFYSAQVMELGVTKAELIQRVSKRKITAMDLEKSEPATTVAQIHDQISTVRMRAMRRNSKQSSRGHSPFVIHGRPWRHDCQQAGSGGD